MHLSQGRIVALGFGLVLGFLLARSASAQQQGSRDIEIESIETKYRFEKDGSGRTETRFKWKALTEAGVAGIRQITIPYDSAYQDLHVTYFKTVKKSGGTVDGDPKQVFDAQPPSTAAAPSFTAIKVKQFVFPNIEAGDEAEYAFTTEIRPMKAGDFWAMQFPTPNLKVVSQTISLDIPADRKVSLDFNHDGRHESKEENGRRIESFSFSNRSGENSEKPLFAVSTFLSWDAFGQWAAALNHASAAVTPEIKALADKLTAGKTPDAQKVAALYQYVSTSIRYVSISFGIGGIQPHQAAEVLKNSYGDCKDKNALFSALLQAAGFHPQTVLAFPGFGILNENVPIPSQFNHAFTAIPSAGATNYFDTTLELAEPQVLMPGVRGKKALLIGPDKSRIIEIPDQSPVSEHVEERMTGAVNKAGNFTAKTSVSGSGFDVLFLRAIFRDGTEEQKHKLLQEIAGPELESASISGISSSDPKDLLHPFSMQYALDQQGFATEHTKRITLASGAPVDMRQLLESKPTKPVPVSARENLRHVDLEIDPVYIVDLRMPVHVKSKLGTYDSEYRYENGHVFLDRTLKLNRTEVQPGDWAEFVKFLNEAQIDETSGFSLERKQAANASSSAYSTRSPVALSKDGHDAIARHDYAAAEKSFSELVKLNSYDQRAWNDLGIAYLGLHKSKEAEEAFKKQIEVNPNDEYAWNNLGRIYLAKSDLDEAEKCFRRQIAVNSRDQFAHGGLARTLELKGNWPEAEKEAKAATEIVPANPLGWIYLGSAQAKLKNTDAARQSFDRALQSADNTGIQNNVAYAMAEAGIELDKAWQLALSALTVEATTVCSPESLQPLQSSCEQRFGQLSAALDTAGYVLYKQDKLEESLPYFRSAYAIVPRGAHALHLAAVLARSGKTDEAIAWYARARASQAFKTLDSKPVEEILAKACGGADQLKTRADAVPKAESKLGFVSSLAGSSLPSGEKKFLVLVDADGKILSAKASDGSDDSAALSKVKALTLVPITWPGHDLKSVRIVDLQSADVYAFVVNGAEHII